MSRPSKSWDELSPNSKYSLYLQGNPRVPASYVPDRKVRGPSRKADKHWHELGPHSQARLALVGDPRVPVDFIPPVATPMTYHSWDELDRKARCKAFRRKDPRVPVGWTPENDELRPIPKSKEPKVHRLQKPWDELSYHSKLVLLRTNSPRVPVGFAEEQEARVQRAKIARANGLRKANGNRKPRSWDQLSEGTRTKLFYGSPNDPRIPIGYLPVSNPQPVKLKPWDTLSAMARKYAFLRGDSRVPKGWKPPPPKPRGRPTTPSSLEAKRKLQADRDYKLPREDQAGELGRWGNVPYELQGLNGEELSMALAKWMTRNEAWVEAAQRVDAEEQKRKALIEVSIEQAKLTLKIRKLSKRDGRLKVAS